MSFRAYTALQEGYQIAKMLSAKLSQQATKSSWKTVPKLSEHTKQQPSTSLAPVLHKAATEHNSRAGASLGNNIC